MAKPVRPDPVISARVRALVDSTSMHKAAQRLGLAEATVARIIGGLPVTRGTELVARERLDGPNPEAA